MKKDNDFDLKDFREHLQQLEKELSQGIKSDPDYGGEIDEVLASLKRLGKELNDPKYEKVLPDLFTVIEFLDMVGSTIEDDEDDEDLDDEDFDDEEIDEDEK